MSALRAAEFLPAAKVNYGTTDGLEPPYISVADYRHTLDYDTGGPALKRATFAVRVIDKSQDDAETLAGQVDDLINNNLDLTPSTIGCLQTSYAVGQLAERLYQFGVEIAYELTEDIPATL